MRIVVTLRTLKGHQGAITTVGFSIDGKQLTSGSADKTARVWDLNDAGAAIRPLEGSLDNPFMARFSPDGQLIAAAGGRSIRLWDAATGRLVRELPAGDNGHIHSVTFSPTDYRLLAVGYGGQADVSYVALWDIDAGTERTRLTGATDLPNFGVDKFAGAVGALAFSPDGKYLVAGFGDPGWYYARKFSQSTEGLGGRHTPTDPPTEWTHGLLCFSRLLEGRNAAGQRQPRRDGDHLVDRDLESDADAPESGSQVF